MKHVGTLASPPTHSILTGKPITKAGNHTWSIPGTDQIVRYESGLARQVTDKLRQQWINEATEEAFEEVFEIVEEEE